jgi:hypothetical protein
MLKNPSGYYEVVAGWGGNFLCDSPESLNVVYMDEIREELIEGGTRLSVDSPHSILIHVSDFVIAMAEKASVNWQQQLPDIASKAVAHWLSEDSIEAAINDLELDDFPEPPVPELAVGPVLPHDLTNQIINTWLEATAGLPITLMLGQLGFALIAIFEDIRDGNIVLGKSDAS